MRYTGPTSVSRAGLQSWFPIPPRCGHKSENINTEEPKPPKKKSSAITTDVKLDCENKCPFVPFNDWGKALLIEFRIGLNAKRTQKYRSIPFCDSVTELYFQTLIWHKYSIPVKISNPDSSFDQPKSKWTTSIILYFNPILVGRKRFSKNRKYVFSSSSCFPSYFLRRRPWHQTQGLFSCQGHHEDSKYTTFCINHFILFSELLSQVVRHSLYWLTLQ